MDIARCDGGVVDDHSGRLRRGTARSDTDIVDGRGRDLGQGCDVVKQGDVLVAEMTTPDFVPAMKRAAATPSTIRWSDDSEKVAIGRSTNMLP